MKLTQNKIIAYKFSTGVYPSELTTREANALTHCSSEVELELVQLTGKTCNYTLAERKLYAKLMQKELSKY